MWTTKVRQLRPREDDHELGKNEGMLLRSLTNDHTFSERLVHLHLYVHAYKVSPFLNIEYVVLTSYSWWKS